MNVPSAIEAQALKLGSGALRLKEAARTINELAQQDADARLALCRAIAGAVDLARKNHVVFRKWADENLRRPDGSKWRHKTLECYASFGRNPQRLESVRKDSARHGDIRREARLAGREGRKVSGIILERQVAGLVFAWRNAGPEARKLFLEKISKESAVAA